MQIPDSKSWHSCGEPARFLGKTPTAVSIAIKDGRLKKCVVRNEYGQPKISDLNLALQEWNENTDQDRVNISKHVPLPSPRSTPHAPIQALSERAEAPTAMVAEPSDDAEDDDPKDYASAAKEQKLWAAKLAKLKYLTAAGELVELKEVVTQYSTKIVGVRNKLAGIPTRLKQQVPSLPLDVVDRLEKILREILEEVASE